MRRLEEINSVLQFPAFETAVQTNESFSGVLPTSASHIKTPTLECPHEKLLSLPLRITLPLYFTGTG